MYRGVISKLLITLGLLCLIVAGFFTWERYTPRRLAFASLPATSLSPKTAEIWPQFLSIPSLGVKLAVFPATVTDRKWSDTKEGVSYLITSPIPGNSGNSIIYGHNWPNLLGPLTKVKPGQSIQVVMNDGKVKSFVVEFTTVVTPDQTHILANTEDARLTIYTCIGFLDSKRFVVTAVPLASS